MDDDKKPQDNTSDGKEPAYMAFTDEKDQDVSPVETTAPAYDTPSDKPAPMVVKKKSNAKKWLLGGLVVLLLAGLSAFAYWQWAEAENARKETASLKSDLELAQRQDNKTVTSDEDSVSVDETSAEDKIEFEANTYLAAFVGEGYVFDSESIVIKDKFATATGSLPAGDAPVKILVLTIVGDEWVVLFAGEKGKVDASQKESLNKEYGVPVSIFGN